MRGSPAAVVDTSSAPRETPKKRAGRAETRIGKPNLRISIIGMWTKSVKGVNKYVKIDISRRIPPQKSIFSFPK